MHADVFMASLDVAIEGQLSGKGNPADEELMKFILEHIDAYGVLLNTLDRPGNVILDATCWTESIKRYFRFSKRCRSCEIWIRFS